MLPQTIFAFATLFMAASAAPYQTTSCKTTSTARTTARTTSTSTRTTSTSTSTRTTATTSTSTTANAVPATVTTTTTTSAAAPGATTNNGQAFTNQCTSTGVSIANCAQLGNIAAGNGNTVNVGGTGTGTTTPTTGTTNNGQAFLNQCATDGISTLTCAQLLNTAILNGNTININAASLTALLTALGLPALLSNLIAGLLPTNSAGLLTLPTGLLSGLGLGV